jgi:hypothetical protein
MEQPPSFEVFWGLALRGAQTALSKRRWAQACGPGGARALICGATTLSSSARALICGATTLSSSATPPSARTCVEQRPSTPIWGGLLAFSTTLEVCLTEHGITV